MEVVTMQLSRHVMCFLLSFFLLMLCSAGTAKTIYVDDDAAGANDGTSWGNAYTFLQEALADARLAEKPVEIRVAQGIYRPNEGLIAIPKFDWRTTTFQLINDVTLKGGYAGIGEFDPNACDIKIYQTILSGDLNDNDADVNEPEYLLDEPTRAENSFHVVTSRDDNPTAVLDGFTITGGNANGGFFDYGAGGLNNGWFSEGSSIMVLNCTFTRNSSSGPGGGMGSFGCDPTLVNCTFSGNSAARGGGMASIGSPTLVNCTFIGNCATHHGMGYREGGGMHNRNGSPTLVNCIFSKNWSSDNGGGMYNSDSDKLTLTNCTFTQNSAVKGNALYFYSLHSKLPSNAEMTNCILWDGGNEMWNYDDSMINVAYCNIQGGWPGLGNIDVDPVFADPDNGDYHLKSEAGRWDPVSDSWVVDDVTSPCIDAGDPDSPVAFESFPNGGIVNMGAYGRTVEASKSPSGLHAKYGGGSGESDNPYLIYTAEQMNTIGLHAEDRDCHFKLMADIDLGDLGTRDFNMIGRFPHFFRGVFDGNGHTISNFTYISTDVDGVALFSYVEGAQAEIRDLGLIDPIIDAGVVNPVIEEDRVEGNRAGSLIDYLRSGAVRRCYVQGGSISADLNTGGLVAYNQKGIIAECSSTVNVSGFVGIGGLLGYNRGAIVNCRAESAVTGRNAVGGLLGWNDGTVQDSSAIGEVLGDTNVGGLVGKNRSVEMIQSSFSTGSVSGVYSVGGLVGNNDTEIANCYSTCSVSGGYNVGGLVGLHRGVITSCYSAGHVVFEPIYSYGDYIAHIGGLLGYASDANDVLQSFWDIETSVQTVSAGGTGLTTAEMHTPSTFLEAGWDFVYEADNGIDDIWWIVEGRDYPRLWWELTGEN